MIAIILVNYNRAKDTIECIDSLAKCCYSNKFIIVVDNNSLDDSIKVLEEAKTKYEFILIKANENKGFSAGNNIGIKYAIENNAEYILLLNNDTLVDPELLEELLKGFSSFENCGATIGKIYYEKQRNKIWYAGGSLNFVTGRTRHWNYGCQTEKPIVKECTSVTFATGCCLCLSKVLIQKIGLLDEDYFLYEEDVEFCYRIIEAGFRIVYVPSAILYHKIGASMGNDSPLTQYYIIRNKFYFIQQHFPPINKLVAYLFSTFQIVIRCIKGEIEFKYYIEALKDFRKRRLGKKREA